VSAFIDLIRAPSELSIGTAAVDNVLAAIREHLGLDVAFVSEFRRQDRIFRHVSAKSRSPIKQGDTCPLDQGYCQRVVDGRLPQLMPDTRRVPAAVALPETQAIPVGSHLSVPVLLADGRVFGTLCCFGFSADASLGERDLAVLKAFASLLGSQLDRDIVSNGSTSDAKARITAALQAGQPSVVYQPIFDLASGALAGLECLSRFQSDLNRTPDKWFAEAASVGLGVELELAAIRSGLEALHETPSNVYLAVNCSPTAILDARVQKFVQATVDLKRVVLEITEHDYVHDYPVLLSVLAPLRAMGLRVAIDDAGAGYASLRHVLHIQPEKIKLDISLTRNVDCDPTRRALASALIAFGRETRAHIVAEGVETAAELQTLARLGVHNAQGYFLARPMPLADALRQVMPSVTISSSPGKPASVSSAPA
jgi:EAL domain-containing protein (putative c-di-GMP-specific phosphodiesterase class I)